MALNDLDITIVNSIRNAASADYAARIPAATRDNITTIANAITEYTPFFTEFTGLLGKIAMQKISSKMAINPLGIFKTGLLPLGTDIEEIFVKMAKAKTFDPDGKTVLSRVKPEIVSMFHRENRKDYYDTSVSRTQLKGAFMNEGGMSKLVNDIVNSLYSGDAQDEFILAKNLLAGYSANYQQREVAAIDSADDAKAFVKAVRKASQDMSFMSDKMNKAAVMTRTDPSEQVLIIHKDVLVEIDVEVLANAFNAGKTELKGQIVPVDDFGTMTTTYAVLVDKDFLIIADTEYAQDEAYNAEGRFQKLFLHHHQILSTSQFSNAIKFTTADVIQP